MREGIFSLCFSIHSPQKRVHPEERHPTFRYRLADLVAPAAALYTKMFAQRHHASLLFAVSELVRSFGRDENVFETLRLSLEEVMGWTSKMLRALPDFESGWPSSAQEPPRGWTSRDSRKTSSASLWKGQKETFTRGLRMPRT